MDHVSRLELQVILVIYLRFFSWNLNWTSHTSMNTSGLRNGWVVLGVADDCLLPLSIAGVQILARACKEVTSVLWLGSAFSRYSCFLHHLQLASPKFGRKVMIIEIPNASLEVFVWGLCIFNQLWLGWHLFYFCFFIKEEITHSCLDVKILAFSGRYTYVWVNDTMPHPAINLILRATCT